MKKVLIALAFVLSGLTVMADDVAKDEPVLCTLAQIRICTPTEECKVRSAEDLGVPRFVIVDPKEGRFRAVLEDRESKIGSSTKEEGLLFMQGLENRRAWSAVISDSKDLTLVATSDGTAFAVFGSCVPMSKIEKE